MVDKRVVWEVNDIDLVVLLIEVGVLSRKRIY